MSWSSVAIPVLPCALFSHLENQRLVDDVVLPLGGSNLELSPNDAPLVPNKYLCCAFRLDVASQTPHTTHDDDDDDDVVVPIPS